MTHGSLANLAVGQHRDGVRLVGLEVHDGGAEAFLHLVGVRRGHNFLLVPEEDGLAGVVCVEHFVALWVVGGGVRGWRGEFLNRSLTGLYEYFEYTMLVV